MADEEQTDSRAGEGGNGAPPKLPGTAPLEELTEQLHERREQAKLGGGEEKIKPSTSAAS